MYWRQYITFTIFLVFYGLILPVSSSNELSKTYTIDELVERALERSDAIYSAKQQVESAYWAKKQALAWQNPTLGFDIGGKSEDNSTGSLYDFRFTQPFYFPGKRKLRHDVAKTGERLAALSVEEEKLFIRYEVVPLSYDYVADQELIEHVQERIARFKVMKEYMKGRPFASPQTKAEKIIVENKLRLLECDLALLQKEREDAWSKLNLYLGFSEKIQIDLRWLDSPLHINLDQIIQEALENNIDLKKLKQERAKLDKTDILTRKEALPDFSLSSFYGEEKAVSDEQQFGIGLAITLPLLNRNVNLSKSIRAEIKGKDARIQLEEKLLKQKLSSLYAQYQAAIVQLQLFPLSLITVVDQELALLDQEFSKNRIDLLTYLEVETQAFEVHIAAYESQLGLLKVYTGIHSLMGQEDFKIGGN